MTPTRPLHLVIPAYNAGRELAAFLPELLATLASSGKQHQILVVDDGSAPSEADSMRASCNELRRAYPALLPLLRIPENSGKGAAIRLGWSQAPKENSLGFVDADGSTAASEVLRLWDALACATSPLCAVIASRKQAPDRKVHYHLRRHLIGRVFAFLVERLFHLGIHDTQCGCKFLSPEAYIAVGPLLHEDRFLFDVELLAALRQAQARIHEIPIDWRDLGRSTVRLHREIPRMALGLLRLHHRLESPPVHP